MRYPPCARAHAVRPVKTPAVQSDGVRGQRCGLLFQERRAHLVLCGTLCVAHTAGPVARSFGRWCSRVPHTAYLNKASVLNAIQTRFYGGKSDDKWESERVYTFAGPNLIALNPYKIVQT